MDDLISRQAAIDVLEERLQANGYSNVALVSELNRSIGYLMRLPSAQADSKELSFTHKALDTISRAAAIDAINHICPVDTEYDCTLLDRVDVRCVLSDLPSAQPEERTEERTETHGVCLDAISRQAAIDKLNEGLDKIPIINNTMNQAIRRDERISCVHELRSLPSAKREYKYGEWCTDCKEYDKNKHSCPRFNAVIKTTIEDMKAERKKGKWKEHKDYPGLAYLCSWCGYFTTDRSYFCPNCGAKMEVEHEQAD